MSGISRVYKISPDRHLKLRNWATANFVLVLFAGIISFLWASNPSVSIPFLYALYGAITIYVLRFAKADIFSPLIFFLFFSFLGFGLKLPLLSLFPEWAFFANPFYNPRFSYNASAISSAFVVFLVGYVAFIIGFNVVKRGIKVGVSERASHPLILAMLSAILITASFYFRSQYLVGVPGYNVAIIEHAGYVYYPLLYGAIITTGLTFYLALTQGSVFYVIAALILFGGSAFAEILLGWKGGAVKFGLIMLMIYYYVSRYRLRNISARIKHWVVAAFLLMVVGTVVLYPIAAQYRYAVLMPSGKVSMWAFGDIIKGTSLNIFQTLNLAIKRASGLDNLVPIVAYFQSNVGETLNEAPSFFANLFDMDIQPEQFYTWYILGVNPNIITTNAPTGWGVLYIWGGIIGVVIGMIIIGMLSKLLYLTFLSNVRRDGRWIVFYTVFMVNIFWPVVFEGTIWKHKDIIALTVIYGFSIFSLDTIRLRLCGRETRT